MASKDAEQTKPLEEKIGDLKLEEKAGVATDAAKDYLDGAKDAAKITKEQVKKDFHEAAEEAEKPSPQDVTSQQVNTAEKEVKKSPDDGAYAVPAVEHRTVEGSGGEEKTVDVPTAIVHENADADAKPPQQGKGIFQSVTGKITTSVKGVFSGFTGGKADKKAEPKAKETSEQ